MAGMICETGSLGFLVKDRGSCGCAEWRIKRGVMGEGIGESEMEELVPE